MIEIPDWMIDATNNPQNSIFELLAKELPEGWNVQVDIENGSGSVSLFWPNDALTEIPIETTIEAALIKALAFAKYQGEQSDTAIEKSWRQFCKAMDSRRLTQS